MRLYKTQGGQFYALTINPRATAKGQKLFIVWIHTGRRWTDGEQLSKPEARALDILKTHARAYPEELPEGAAVELLEKMQGLYDISEHRAKRKK